MVRAKDKGARGEREVRDLFRAYGFDADRVPLSGATDVMKGDVLVEGLHVEVKRAEATRLWEWIAQAQGQCADRPWWLCLRRNRTGWYVVMDLEQALELLAQVRHHSPNQVGQRATNACPVTAPE